MDKSTGLYPYVDRLFEHPLVFNLNQVILDGGKTRQIRRFLADVPYQSVVDIGCGTGNWAKLARGPYLGVDTSPSFIAACRRRYANDPQKQFVQADAMALRPETPFDLACLISVLHHLSDAEVARLCAWVSRSARYFFVLDLYPIPHNPISRWLYQMDRGNHIRDPEAQQALLLRDGRFRLVKRGAYYSPNRLYRHTLFLLEANAAVAERTP